MKFNNEHKERITLDALKKGLNLSQLADALGVHISYLSSVLNGKKEFSIKFFVKLAGYLNYSVSDFVEKEALCEDKKDK